MADIKKSFEGEVYNIALKGNFTFFDLTPFRELLIEISNKDIRRIALDMKEVTFIDSAALGALLLMHDEAEKHHKRLSVRNISGQVEKMFNVANFGTVFIRE